MFQGFFHGLMLFVALVEEGSELAVSLGDWAICLDPGVELGVGENEAHSRNSLSMASLLRRARFTRRYLPSSYVGR